VRGVDLELWPGRTLGLVGESGCGKSTLGRCVLALERPDAGEVIFDGAAIQRMPSSRLRPLRRQMQLIFQDPKLSLDPKMTVEQIVAEPLVIHRLARGAAARRERVLELLQQVGLEQELLQRLPHQLSGGQRQRVGIARAMASGPRLIVADEPVSALDLPIRLQVVRLLGQLQRRHRLALLLISHDLQVVRHVAHEVAVMYLGRLVERAPTQRLVQQPRHPYSRALLAAARPPGQADGASQPPLQGEVPSPLAPPSGCAFHPRCELYARRGNPACTGEVPQPRQLGPGQEVACHEVD
jgi:oligopeptide/dipeptide ABC transporter ATP-binding protein